MIILKKQVRKVIPIEQLLQAGIVPSDSACMSAFNPPAKPPGSCPPSQSSAANSKCNVVP